MDHFAGLDVSVKETSICIVDDAGKIVREVKVASEPEALLVSKRAWRWRGSSEGLTPTTPIELERYAGPVFLSHGEDDQMWSVECTRRLENRLRSAGRVPEVHYYPGEAHGFKCESRSAAQARLIAFFSKHLIETNELNEMT